MTDDLRSMTGGRGAFTMSFSHYEEMPTHLAEKVIAEHRKKGWKPQPVVDLP